MILKALYDYYQAMAKLGKDEIARFGMDWVTISFVIIINEDGTFKDIESTKLEALLPTDKTRTAAVVPYILWDKASYVLGLSDKEGGRVKQEFDSFRKEIQKIHKEHPENIGFRAIHLFDEKEQYLVA
ncbi:type I-C CRISPR-associated protein Cas8c/Csd1, partial [Porphyromonas sp.]